MRDRKYTNADAVAANKVDRIVFYTSLVCLAVAMCLPGAF